MPQLNFRNRMSSWWAAETVKHADVIGRDYVHRKVILEYLRWASYQSIASTILHLHISLWVRGEQEFPFPTIPKNESLWFPFPNYENGFFIPFLFPNFGNGFFISLPVPELWEWFFSLPSHSRMVEMDFFIPFPFPKLPFHRRESKRELEVCERYQTFNIFSLLYIFYNNLYWGGKMSLLVDWIGLDWPAGIGVATTLRIVHRIVSDWKDKEFCSVLLQIVMLQRC